MHSRYAVVLALRHSGMSYKEIAGIMHVKVNQVGTLLVRAEAAFKKECVPLQNATGALNLVMPIDGIWRAAAFVAAGPPTPAYLFWCAAWLIVAFCAGTRAFLRRDL